MTERIASYPVAVPQARINTFLAQVYFLMSIGFVVTGLVASWTASDPDLLMSLSLNPWIAFGLFIIQIAVVAGLSARATRLSGMSAALLFLLYAGLTGLTLSSIFLVYTRTTISSVFWVTAGTFLITSLFGILFKRDLTSSGNVLFMLLLGWSFAWLFSWLFPFSGFNWVLTYAGIAIFVGLTAHDAQRLAEMGRQLGTRPAAGLVAIGALTLYLDFVNTFLLMLRASKR